MCVCLFVCVCVCVCVYVCVRVRVSVLLWTHGSMDIGIQRYCPLMYIYIYISEKGLTHGVTALATFFVVVCDKFTAFKCFKF